MKLIPFLMFSVLHAVGGEVTSVPSPARVQSTTTYELRGFYGKGDRLEVSIRDSRDGSSRWLRVGKKSGEFLIEKADAKSGTATLVADGVKKELKLVAEESPPAAVPATREKLNELFRLRDEVVMRPGVGDELNAMLAEVDVRFNKEHPEYPGLMKKVFDSREDTPESREIKIQYERLSEQRSDLFKALIKNSGNPDLLEFSRLNDEVQQMSAKVPSKFEVGFRYSYGNGPSSSEKPSDEPAPVSEKK